MTGIGNEGYIRGNFGTEESASFFAKKRSKKNSYIRGVAAPNGQTPTINKSFLLLFFKKEALSCVSKSLDIALHHQASLAAAEIKK
jgi:hypothetical protein